jgi:hypothetical protein
MYPVSVHCHFWEEVVFPPFEPPIFPAFLLSSFLFSGDRPNIPVLFSLVLFPPIFPPIGPPFYQPHLVLPKSYHKFRFCFLYFYFRLFFHLLDHLFTIFASFFKRKTTYSGFVFFTLISGYFSTFFTSLTQFF